MSGNSLRTTFELHFEFWRATLSLPKGRTSEARFDGLGKGHSLSAAQSPSLPSSLSSVALVTGAVSESV